MQISINFFSAYVNIGFKRPNTSPNTFVQYFRKRTSYLQCVGESFNFRAREVKKEIRREREKRFSPFERPNTLHSSAGSKSNRYKKNTLSSSNKKKVAKKVFLTLTFFPEKVREGRTRTFRDLPSGEKRKLFPSSCVGAQK